MKRLALGLIVLALILPTEGKAQNRGTAWTCSLDARDDAPVLCISAPEPGMRRYITDVLAQSTKTSSGFFNLIYNTAKASGGQSDCGGTAFTLLPAGLSNNSSRFQAAANTSAPTLIRPPTPVIVPKGMDLCVVGDATNTATVQLIGYVAP